MWKWSVWEWWKSHNLLLQRVEEQRETTWDRERIRDRFVYFRCHLELGGWRPPGEIENVLLRKCIHEKKREREEKKIHSCGETAPVVFLRLNEMRRGTIDRREEAGSEVFFFFFLRLHHKMDGEMGLQGREDCFFFRRCMNVRHSPAVQRGWRAECSSFGVVE